MSVKNPAPRTLAIQAGELTYFTGKPCKYGHVERRDTVTGTCLTCLDVYRKTARLKVKEALKEARR